jgi:hypothetical protein
MFFFEKRAGPPANQKTFAPGGVWTASVRRRANAQRVMAGLDPAIHAFAANTRLHPTDRVFNHTKFKYFFFNKSSASS